jgi:hypothetical protein
MTDLTKRIKRRTTGTYQRRKRLVVILMPGDVIGIREERCRKLFTAPIDRVYRQIVHWHVEAARAEKQKPKTTYRFRRSKLR